jgi:hypothetical protein
MDGGGLELVTNRCRGESTKRPGTSGTTSRRKRLRRKSATEREWSPNQASAPAIRNIAGMPHGKQKPAKALRTTLRWWLETSQVPNEKTSATWNTTMPYTIRTFSQSR